MCGIVGYTGPREARDIIMAGLARLEYRGYDSAGIAVLSDGALEVVRRAGKLENLREVVAQRSPAGNLGIGHTRWATHGAPTDENAHPHTDCSGRLAVVHNGIIENFVELRQELQASGHTLRSETDTEVIAHLIEAAYAGDLTEAVAQAVSRLDGSFAVAVVHQDHPDTLVAARKDSPLIIGLGDGETLIASDIPAVLEHTRRVMVLEDGDIVTVTPSGATLRGADASEAESRCMQVDWDLDAAEKGGFEDFMLKEIHEQPVAVRQTLAGRMGLDGTVQLSELQMTHDEVSSMDRLQFVACGTSYHAALIGKYLIEKWARIPVSVAVSSEFRYTDPIVDDQTLVVAISQSGETTDTMAAVREAQSRGARVVAIANVVGSSITREADGVIYTHAGPEIGVAATKTFTAQIAAVYVLALHLAQANGGLSALEAAEIWAELELVPDIVQRILDDTEAVDACAEAYVHDRYHSSLFLGRGIGLPVAMEGALKLKEISYIHAEAYPAGEMKHGPIALVTNDVPVVVVATQSDTYDKVVSNIQEVKARGADVIAVATEGDDNITRHADHVLYVPKTSPDLSAIPAVIPLQLLAYRIAKLRGCNVDQPRNLAKSVTVE
ncbi:MAG: glutamine--fructose-6-phosphate transaminase (isomerizing) [Coriobacteriia bacterium]